MQKIKIIATLIFILHVFPSSSQIIKPGFIANEYKELLMLPGKYRDSSENLQAGNHKMMYRSPRVGLANCAEIWLRNDNVGVIHIQGTIPNPVSWLENFYCAMLPAIGSLKMNDSTTFNYKLAENKQAYVHVGWLTAVANLAPEIIPQLNFYKEKGVTEYYIMGHSQGGGIAFLLTSYLYYLQSDKKLDSSFTFKTYCSAAPKPGNLYYAYDFDFITRNGKAFRVVNTADWVPETPFSIQSLKDFNQANPFSNAKAGIKKQKFLARLYLNHVYNKLNKSSSKAMKTFRKQLGKNLYKQVKKTMPQFEEPNYEYSMNYMTAGVPIILQADDAYYRKYVFNGSNVFVHHFLNPYNDLIERYYEHQ